MIKLLGLLSMFMVGNIHAQQSFNKLNVKELDVSSRINVASTTKSSKPCPAMTETQRNAIVSPLNGSCIYNTTTLKLNVYNGTIWKAAGGGVDAWATASVYAVDDLVIQSSKIYIALIAHTSGVFATDLAANKWAEVSQGVTSHLDLTNIGTNTHAQIDTHIGSTSNPHSVTKSQVGLGSVLDVDTTTTANISDSTDKRFVTDANLTLLGLTSGTNTGDNSPNSLYSGLATSKQDTLVSGTNIKTVNSNSLLGSGDLVITVPDLTGPITSLAGVTSVASQTGTGSTFVMQNTPTLTTPNIGAATGTSLTLAGNISAYNYDNLNMLINGNIENPLGAEWTCTVGTCARTTSAGEFTQGLAALKVTLAAQSMNVSQTITTPSGIMKQGYARFTYLIPATGVVTPTITITVDSTLQVTVPSDKLLMDGMFHQIEVPFIFGSTDVKVSYLTGSSTGDVFIDLTGVYQGLGLQNLQGDTVYSAQVTTTSGAIANQTISKELFSSCTAANPTVCTFVSGRFTNIPVCTATTTSNGGNGPVILQSGKTTSGITFTSTDTAGGAPANIPFDIHCAKTGNDYLNSSANVYSQSSADTDWIPCTYSTLAWQGFGTIASNQLECRKDGQSLKIRGRFQAGTTAPSTAQIPLPNNWGSITSKVISTSSSGQLHTNAASVSNLFNAIIENGLNYITVAGPLVSSANNPYTTVNGSTFLSSSGQAFIYGELTIPITQWSNSNSIIGSFAGVPAVPGYEGKVDTFEVLIGTTNLVTPCTGTPCFIRNLGGGNAASSVTRSSTGTYTLNTSKTYGELSCNFVGLETSGYSVSNQNSALYCTNCSSLSTSLARMPAGTGADAYGKFICKGVY